VDYHEPERQAVLAKRRRPFADESVEEMARRALEIDQRLEVRHPDAKVALSHRSPLQLMVATILSAQCTDERVNMVTPGLFQRYQTAEEFAEADTAELESIIHSTGFFRQKAKSIRSATQKMVEEHDGEVPREMDELTRLPGIGRKTANVIRGGAWGLPGITVDTHVKRLSRRMGLTDHTDPVKIEFDLNELLPEERWFDFSSRMIFHGRRVCDARKPDCGDCSLTDLCRYYQEETEGTSVG
jgi:endonuclease-3